MSKLSKLLSVVLLVAFALTACGPTNTPAEEPVVEAPVVEEPVVEEPVVEEPVVEEPVVEEPVEPEAMGVKLADLDGVEVEFWHVWDRGVGDALQSIVDAFNAENEYGITVVALDQGGYGDIFTNMNAAINTGELPDLAVGYNNQYLAWDGAGDIIVDLNPYMADPTVGYSEEEIADFFQAFFDQDVIAGERLGLPAQRSGEFYFYNITWAQELGFDAPPVTPDDFYAQACAAAAANGDGTGGWFINTGASSFASWVWSFGGELVDAEGNYNLNSPEAVAVLEYLYKLYNDGCAFVTENSYPNPEFATRQGLFSSSSIAGLPYQYGANEEAGSTDAWTVISYPHTTPNPEINMYGPSIAMISSTPEEQLASWLFLQYWLKTESQVTWIETSRYFPTRASAEEALSGYAADNPIWAEGLSYRDYGNVEPRFASWSDVRYTISDYLALIFQDDFDPTTIPALLDELQAEALAQHAESLP